MQTILLLVVLFYPGEQPNEFYQQPMPDLAQCWRAAEALTSADISRAEPLIGVGAGCAVIGRPVHARQPAQPKEP